MIRCVVFDFDGTLVRSNYVKRESFFIVTSEIAGADIELNNMFAANFPGDRSQIFTELSNRIQSANPSKVMPDCRSMAAAYGKLCHDKICSCEEISGASRALSKLRDGGVLNYLISATPEHDLKSIVAERRLNSYFKGVYGRPKNKTQHLKNILAQESIRPIELVMVGDGLDDQVAAASVSCNFIAVTNSGNPNPPRIDKSVDISIDDMCALPEILRGLGND